MTWKLWRWVQTPVVRHPLYQRIVTMPQVIMPWYVGCAFIVLSPIILLPGMVFLSGVYGIRWAVQIAGSIAYERENGMYELLVLTPAGRIGINRAIMSANLFRNESFEQLQSLGAWVIRGFFTLTLMMIATSTMGIINPVDGESALAQVVVPLYLVTMGAAIYIDHVQSIVLAVVVGMLVPTFTTRRIDAGAAALILYLVCQVCTYVLTLLIGFNVAPYWLEGMGVSAMTQALILPFIRLVVFAASREGCIYYFWRVIVREMNTTPSEVQIMTH